jgi:hypothetical protein
MISIFGKTFELYPHSICPQCKQEVLFDFMSGATCWDCRILNWLNKKNEDDLTSRTEPKGDLPNDAG